MHKYFNVTHCLCEFLASSRSFMSAVVERVKKSTHCSVPNCLTVLKHDVTTVLGAGGRDERQIWLLTLNFENQRCYLC